MNNTFAEIEQRYNDCRELLYINRKVNPSETSAEADMEWLIEEVGRLAKLNTELLHYLKLLRDIAWRSATHGVPFSEIDATLAKAADQS